MNTSVDIADDVTIFSDAESILFITYDGLLDPLGGSQILPYLYSIAKHPRSLHILSFEKPDRFASGADDLRTKLTQLGIGWTPLSFTTRFGILGKMWDLARMYFWGVRLAINKHVKIVHARGHSAAQIGFFIKRIFDAKLIFDFRGLWVDERVDKGGWNLDRPFHRLQYRYFKKMEHKLLINADHIVVLTHAVVDEVVRLGASSSSKITVIPCCADFEHFSLVTEQSQVQAREGIGIPSNALILGYLGSVGSMYMPDRFLRLFELAVHERDDTHALVITQDVKVFQNMLDKLLPSEMHWRVHIKSASRSEVPKYIEAMDILISFIQPSYARKAASPTKMAECFAEGVPAICNAGVGDAAEQIKLLNAGVVIDPSSENDILSTIKDFDTIKRMGGRRLREESRQIFGLEIAEKKYQSVYSKIKEIK